MTRVKSEDALVIRGVLAPFDERSGAPLSHWFRARVAQNFYQLKLETK